MPGEGKSAALFSVIRIVAGTFSMASWTGEDVAGARRGIGSAVRTDWQSGTSGRFEKLAGSKSRKRNYRLHRR